MQIYVASSWRNARQPNVVSALRAVGHDVYDFRNPRPGDVGFAWTQIDPDWRLWTPEKFRAALSHPVAADGFRTDYDAMKWATACVLVMPCGRSAHLEAGYFVGARKPLVILLSDGEPELMYALATAVCTTVEEVRDALSILAY
jgi:hypothetical protein